MNRAFLWGLSVSLSVAAPLAFADDFFSSVAESADSADAYEEKIWSIGGFVQQQISVGVGSPTGAFQRTEPDVTRLESKLNINGQWQVLDSLSVSSSVDITKDWVPEIESSLSYQLTEDDTENRDWSIDWQEAVIEFQWQPVWVSVGLQTVALGEAESAVVLDVFTPQNNQWIGQADLDETRLPIPAIHVASKLGSGELNALISYEAGFDEAAASGSEFDPFIELRPLNVEFTHNEADKPVEWGLWWQGQLAGSDLTVLAAEVNQNQPHLENATFTLIDSQPVPSSITTAQNRYRVLGISANRTFGRWLVRGEGAYKLDYIATPSTENILSPWLQDDLLQGVAGLEWNGPAGWIVSGEMLAEYLSNADALTVGWGGRVQWQGFNDRLSIQGIAAGLPADTLQVNHGLSRLNVGWDVMDGWNVDASAVWYWADEADQFLYPYRHQDSVSLSVRGSF